MNNLFITANFNAALPPQLALKASFTLKCSNMTSMVNDSIPHVECLSAGEQTCRLSRHTVLALLL